MLYNIAFSLLAMAIFVFNSRTVNSEIFLFAKITGFVCAIGLHYYSSKESYFYFRNAGYSMRRIFLNAFIVDIIVYFIITILSILISHI